MKRIELIFGAVLVPVDFVMLMCAGLLAYLLRFQTAVTQLQPVIYEIPLSQYMTMLLAVSFGWMIIFAFSGLYTMTGTRKIMEEVRRIFLACSTSLLFIIVIFFFHRDLFSSRFIILAAYVFALICVTCGRLIVLAIQRRLFAQGVGVRDVALIGDGHSADLIANEIASRTALGLRIIYHATIWNADTEKQLLALHHGGNLDAVLTTGSQRNTELHKAMYHFCDTQHITFLYTAELFDTESSHMRIQPIAGIPVIEVLRTPLDGWGRILKRLFDIVCSLIVITIGLPIYLFIGLCILIDSGFPIFFSRKDDGSKVMRVGQYGKVFHYFKFRSMKPGTDSLRYSQDLQKHNARSGSPLVKIVNDPRITRFGQFLRKYSIDEMPEFFLVLKGDMSVVGPRPHLPEEVAQYAEHHRRVLSMKPGITGLAQVSGRSDLDFEDEVRLDTFYMEHWSLWLDIMLVLKTPFILFKKRKAL